MIKPRREGREQKEKKNQKIYNKTKDILTNKVDTNQRETRVFIYLRHSCTKSPTIKIYYVRF